MYESYKPVYFSCVLSDWEYKKFRKLFAPQLKKKKKKTISNTLKHCSISKGELFGSYLYKIQTFQNFQFQSSTLLAANEKIP